jgi:hypothetical protein
MSDSTSKNNSPISELTPGVVPWPKPINETGRYGIAGEFLNLVEPHTEADPNALLLTFLTYAGNLMGRNFFVHAGADQHFGNLYTCLIGNTGYGRKGSSMAAVEKFYSKGSPPRLGKRLWGISTGEAVVYEVHDDIYRSTLDKKTQTYQRMLAEPNEPEKRLLIVLSEFQQCLANMRKNDSILPSILRTAWDKGELATPAKTSRATATGAHVSLITGMSREELLEQTGVTDAESGTLNRFLFCCSRRSKLLPEGGHFHKLYKSEVWKGIQTRLASNVDTMEEQVHVSRDTDAAEIWGLNEQPERGLYKFLSTPRIGLWGAITARAPQMVLRLALIIAAINGHRVIQPEHLSAAEEIWRYCDDSTKYIFGDRMDDQVAIDIMEALRAIAPNGLNRTQIYKIWNGRVKRPDIDRSLLWISHAGIARVERTETTRAGRPSETWYAS